MDPLALGFLFVLFMGGGKTKRQTARSAADDGAELVRRANQPRGLAWAKTFQQTGVDAPKALAEAMARWAGIESSGDPLTMSSIGERGLMQVTRTTALKEHALTTEEWDDLQRPTTTTTEHAQIAYRLVNWLWDRAKRYLTNPPTDYVSAVWYAKMYHQRPVDVRDRHAHGPALLMARELAGRWKDDPAKMHRLRAADVVAWGVPNP